MPSRSSPDLTLLLRSTSSVSPPCRIGFTKVTVTATGSGPSGSAASQSVSYPIDSQQCSNYVYSSSSSSSACVSSGSGSSVTLCIPPGEFGVLAGAKGACAFQDFCRVLPLCPSHFVSLCFFRHHRPTDPRHPVTTPPSMHHQHHHLTFCHAATS